MDDDAPVSSLCRLGAHQHCERGIVPGCACQCHEADTLDDWLKRNDR